MLVGHVWFWPQREPLDSKATETDLQRLVSFAKPLLTLRDSFNTYGHPRTKQVAKQTHFDEGKKMLI